MTYQIEDFEPMPEEEFEEVQNELPLDGSVSIMELAQRQLEALQNETDNEAEELPQKANVSTMPPIAELLVNCEAYSASPQALAKIGEASAPDSDQHPLQRLEIGQCFTLPLEWFSKNDLAKFRSAVSMWASRNSRKFCVISHKNYNVLEVARIE